MSDVLASAVVSEGAGFLEALVAGSNIAKGLMEGAAGLNTSMLQRESFEYTKKQNKLLRKREDNAIRRRVRDLKAAGLNPVLAAGQPAQSALGHQLQAPTKSPFEGVADMVGSIPKGVLAYQDTKLRQTGIDQAEAALVSERRRAELLEAEAEKTKIDAWRTAGLAPQEIKALMLGNDLKSLELQYADEYFDLRNAGMRLANEYAVGSNDVRIELLKAQLAGTNVENELRQARLEFAEMENVLKKVDVDMAEIRKQQEILDNNLRDEMRSWNLSQTQAEYFRTVANNKLLAMQLLQEVPKLKILESDARFRDAMHWSTLISNVLETANTLFPPERPVRPGIPNGRR